MKIKDLKCGDYFKLKANGRVYVRGEYSRFAKKYSYCDFNDMNSEHFCSGDKDVIIELEDSDFEKS